MTRPAPEELDALFRDYARNGRRKTRNALVEAHIGFAYHLARRFGNGGIPEDDLRQIAVLGLVKAVDRFDPDVGAAFTTFAGRTIEGEIKRHFRDAAWSVRVPRSTKERHLEVRRAREQLGHRLGRSPTVREVASHLGIARDDVLQALVASAAFTSSSLEPGRVDGSGEDRSRRLAERDDDLDGTVDRVFVERMIQQLPEREQTIVRLRFFEELTQSEIAERVGVSQMHVSRLLRRSLALLGQSVEATPGDDEPDPMSPA